MSQGQNNAQANKMISQEQRNLLREQEKKLRSDRLKMSNAVITQMKNQADPEYLALQYQEEQNDKQFLEQVVAAKTELKKDLNTQAQNLKERLNKRKEEQNRLKAMKKNAVTTKNTSLKTFNFECSPERQNNQVVNPASNLNKTNTTRAPAINFIPSLDDNEISMIQQDQVDVSAIVDQSFTINQMLSKMNNSRLQISLGEDEPVGVSTVVDDEAYIKEIKDISQEVDHALERLQKEH